MQIGYTADLSCFPAGMTVYLSTICLIMRIAAKLKRSHPLPFPGNAAISAGEKPAAPGGANAYAKAGIFDRQIL
jgi:hypothetical protein